MYTVHFTHYRITALCRDNDWKIFHAITKIFLFSVSDWFPHLFSWGDCSSLRGKIVKKISIGNSKSWSLAGLWGSGCVKKLQNKEMSVSVKIVVLPAWMEWWKHLKFSSTIYEGYRNRQIYRFERLFSDIEISFVFDLFFRIMPIMR